MASLLRPHPTVVRVLLVEDQDAMAADVCAILGDYHAAEFRVTRSDGVESALRELAERSYDVMLLDVSLPEGEGITVLRRVREAIQSVPIVVLGNAQDEALALETVSLGAQDYLSKEDPTQKLTNVLLNAIERHRTLTELRTARMREHHLATHDALTGLLNRHAFLERLGESIARARRHDEGLGVLFVDLDNFKAVNDALGHSAGDEVLRITAERLRRCLRGGDPVARFAGDEFTALVHDARKDRDLGIVAGRILEELHEPFRLLDKPISIEASIGIALFPSDGNGPDELIRNADAAMYQAKSNGRGRFHFYEEGVNRSVANRLRMESSLRQAVERNELIIHYQAQVDLTRSEFTGVEALLRWRSEDGGIAVPATFMAAAEGLGLMGEMGEWVLRNACREIGGMKDEEGSLSLSVNVSRAQVEDPKFPELVFEVLADSGIPPRLLELEVNEELLTHDLHRAREVLSQLKRRGVRIALDAFGSGAGSLQAVRKIPFDSIKIDRSFVQALPSDPTAASVVAAIVKLCEGLGCQPVAVGVEREEQARELLRLGCARMQGFAFAAPVPIQELGRALREPAG